MLAGSCDRTSAHDAPRDSDADAGSAEPPPPKPPPRWASTAGSAPSSGARSDESGDIRDGEEGEI